MAVYDIEGTKYTLPDDLTQEEKNAFFESKMSKGDTSPVTQPASAAEQKTLYDIDLQHDPDYVTAAKTIYSKREGKPFSGTDAEAADYGTNMMGWFNYNLPVMALNANKMRSADPDEAKSFLYLMDTYDKLGVSWNGAGRALKGIAADPTSYIGLTTLGIGTAAGAATKVATKQAVKEALTLAVRTGIEGGVMGAAQAALEQQTRVNAGGQDSVDPTKVLTGAAIGGAFGGVLGGAGSVAGTALRKGASQDASGLAAKAEGSLPSQNPLSAAGEAPSRVLEPLPPQALTPPDPGLPIAALEAPPTSPPANLSPETTSVLSMIRDIASDTVDMHGFPTGRQEVDIKFNAAVKELSDKSPQEIDRFIDDVRGAELRGEEMSGVKSVLKQFNDMTAAKHSEALANALNGDVKSLEQVEQLQLILDRVTKADTDFSSMSGTDLSNRVGSFNTGDMRDITPTSILKEKGINPELATTDQKLKASQEYDRLYKAYLDKIEAQPRMQELGDELSKALDEGDYGRANVIQTELDGIRKAETDLLNSSLPTKVKDGIIKGQQALIEWMVGGALSTSSALVNTLMSGVQTVIRPLGEYVGNNPISKAEFNRLMGTYGAMITQSDVALKKAILAFRYEETLTGKDYSRFMEHAPVIPGTVGKAVRFFPNLLNSTDQFFAHLNYMGYVNGTAAAQATEKAADLGLKGSQRDQFIKAEMAKAVNSAYVNPGINSLFDRVRDQGIKRGYKGEKLSLFIKTELNKNADLLGEASELQGLNYMKDTLFKREFTGDHEGTKTLSAIAKGYEDGMNKVPILRALQLFFRTPVRVAEQVARLTPGINTVVLFNDLKGVNGPQRQARAYGEMFLSQAIAAKALVEYAEGKGSGSGPDDFREKRLQEQAGKKFSAEFDAQGNALGLNNLDPLFGPKKIIWSTLDRMAMIQFRKAQGEYVDQEEKATRDMLMSGFISLYSTVKDMNMLGGVQEIIKAAQVMGDPKAGEDAASQFGYKKFASLIPGLVSKSMNLYGADPEKTDPKTLWQFVHSRINPSDERIPRQYDAIGKPVEVINPVAAITGLDLSTRAMRHGSDTPKEIAVKQELARIATATKASFAMPYKLPETQFGDLDLRENYTADGKETIYDRLQRYYRESGVTDALHSYVVEQDGGYGTAKDDGPKAIAAKTIINKFHQYAAGKLFMEEEKLMDARMKRAAGKMDAVLGKKEVFGSPYNQ